MASHFKSICINLVLILGYRIHNIWITVIFTPQPLRAVRVLFSPMVSGWERGHPGRQQEKVCLGCISETVRCRKLILGRDIG